MKLETNIRSGRWIKPTDLHKKKGLEPFLETRLFSIRKYYHLQALQFFDFYEAKNDWNEFEFASQFSFDQDKHQKHATYHVNKLGDREAKLDDDNITDVAHRSGPFIVADEEFFKEFVFCMSVDPTVW